jgi:hypothetical protein
VPDQQPLDNSSAERNSASSGQVSRRAFLSGTAAGVVGGGALAYGGFKSALVPASAAAFQSPAALSATDDGPGVSESVRDAASSLTPGCGSEPLELIVALIRQKYPDDRLDDAALDFIRDGISGQLRRSRVLSRFPLQNGDRPALVFTPFLAAHAEDD